jgi:hypothetical protein
MEEILNRPLFPKLPRIAATVVLLATPAVLSAGVVFSEDFENPNGLADGKWGRIGSALLVANPSIDANNPSAHVVEFQIAGSGGDLFSVFFPAGAGDLELSFDFYETVAPSSSYAWAGTDHQNVGPCGAPCDEQWLWNNSGGAIYGTTPPLNTWTHVSFEFPPLFNNPSLDSAHPGQIVLKLEGTPGNVFFDNLEVTAVPEPGATATLCLVLLSLAARRRLTRPRSL